MGKIYMLVSVQWWRKWVVVTACLGLMTSWSRVQLSLHEGFGIRCLQAITTHINSNLKLGERYYDK
jgi:hypothetical protein